MGEKIEGEIALYWEEKPFQTTFTFLDGQLEMAAQFENHQVAAIYDVVNYFIGEKLPFPLTDWQVLNGTIDGEIAATFRGEHIEHVAGSLRLDHLDATNEVLAIRGGLSTLDAIFEIDPETGREWNGEFALAGGALCLEEECWHGIWDITDLHSTICVKEGVIETSFFRGNLMGMEGRVDLDWNSPDTLMHLAFSGSSKEALALVPEKFQKGFHQGFPNDQIQVEATVNHAKEGLELVGEMWIESHRLQFGCHFGRGGEADLSRMPDVAFSEHLKTQFCLSNKRLGWFKGQKLPMEKFISPFVLGNTSMDLSGEMNIEGTFDTRYLVAFYEGQDVRLEGPSFALFSKQISDRKTSDITAVHYVDLKTWEHVGYLPLKKASHQQKNHDLFFSEVDTLVEFENNVVRLKEVSTNWQGIPFQGEVEIVVRSFDDVDFSIWAGCPQGSLMVGQRLLRHFMKPGPLLELPLSGTFAIEQNGLYFKYNCTSQANLIDGYVHGRCFFDMQQELFSLQACEANFNYSYPEKSFCLLEGEGEIATTQTSAPFLLPRLIFTDDHVTIDAKIADYAFDGTVEQGKIALHGDQLDVEGEYGEGRYTFSHLRLGLWEAEAQLSLDANYAYLESFLLSHPVKGTCDVIGCFDRRSSQLRCYLSDLQLDLAAGLGQLLTGWQPKGVLSGEGEVQWSAEKGVEARLQTSFLT